MKHDLFALTVSLDSLTSLDAAATLSIMASALPRYPRPQKRGIPLKTACMPFKFSTLPGWWRRRKTNETSGIMKGYRRKNKTINHSKKKKLLKIMQEKKLKHLPRKALPSSWALRPMVLSCFCPQISSDGPRARSSDTWSQQRTSVLLLLLQHVN